MEDSTKKNHWETVYETKNPDQVKAGHKKFQKHHWILYIHSDRIKPYP